MATELVNRLSLGTSEDMSTAVFLSLCVDYRQVGNRTQQREQMHADFQALDRQNQSNGPVRKQLFDVAADYIVLISSEYRLNVTPDSFS